MAHSNALIVAIVALLAACATCVPDTGAAVAVQDAGSVDSSLSVGARDLLRKKKRTKKTKKKRVRRADSVAENTNLEGVLVNQQTTANIDGDGNGVVGGETAPITNAVVDVGDIFFDRKLKSVGGGARDLLRKKRKSKKSKKTKRVRRADSVAQNINDEGVLINQQTTANIDGDGNGVVGGETAPIFNANLQTGDIFFDRRKLLSAPGGARDLLRKKRKSKKTKKTRRVRRADSTAVNDNDEGVLINQQTTANIDGDGNGVVGGETAPIFNANIDIEDIIFDDRRKLLSAQGGARDLLRKKRKSKKTKKTRRVRRADSTAVNANDEGVLVNQQTTANIDGDGNLVEGGFTAPIFNANVDVEDIFIDRKLLSAPGGGARDLLRKKRRKSKKTTKKNIRRSRSEAINVNNEGVLVNQQTNAQIEGDGNGVVGGFTDEIDNINIDVGDLIFP